MCTNLAVVKAAVLGLPILDLNVEELEILDGCGKEGLEQLDTVAPWFLESLQVVETEELRNPNI